MSKKARIVLLCFLGVLLLLAAVGIVWEFTQSDLDLRMANIVSAVVWVLAVGWWIRDFRNIKSK